MPYEFFDYSETGNWNVNQGYADIKILKPLIELDEYMTVAKHGTSELVAEFITTEEQRTEARIKGLKWSIDRLILIIVNTRRFLTRKVHKEQFAKHKETLKKMEELIPKVFTQCINQRDNKRRTVIDEKIFSKFYDMLEEIKEDLTTPLRRAEIIFSAPYTDDIKKVKRDIKRDLMTRG